MRVIITESQNAILRRYGRIKELFDNYLLVHNVTPFDTFESFFQGLCWDIAVNMIDQTRMDQDSYVTLRNQIIQFVKNHFYEEYKEWWERRTNRISENVSSKEKSKRFLKDELNIDFTNSIQQVTSSYDVPMEFDDIIGPDGIRRYLNFWGPMYLIEIDGMRFLYQDRVDTDGRFEWFLGEDGIDYVDNEIIERLGIDVMGLRFSDIINMYFNEEETLNEDVNKNKKFLSNVMGDDFTGNIEQVTSVYDVPYSFYRKGIFTMPDVAAYLNKFGPMYIIELYGRKFIYQDRSRYESFISEDGMVYQDTIPEQLGIDVMGLRFSDIVDIYFNEEDKI